MKKEIKGCKDCPFRVMGGWEGEVSECLLTNKEISTKDNMSFSDEYIHPKWCPLNKEEITVKLINP